MTCWTRSTDRKKMIRPRKYCKTCRKTKRLEEFRTVSGNIDGRGWCCNTCYRAKEKLLAQGKNHIAKPSCTMDDSLYDIVMENMTRLMVLRNLRKPRVHPLD